MEDYDYDYDDMYADEEAFASAGHGMDESYGFFGEDEMYEQEEELDND